MSWIRLSLGDRVGEGNVNVREFRMAKRREESTIHLTRDRHQVKHLGEKAQDGMR